MLFKSRGKPAVPALVKCLKDPDKKVRQNAAVALREIGEEPDLVVPALMENLRDSDREVRMITAIALGAFGDRAKASVPAFLELIKEYKGDDFTIGALYDALYRIDPTAAAKLARE
jgi:HEAT repeat protein